MGVGVDTTIVATVGTVESEPVAWKAKTGEVRFLFCGDTSAANDATWKIETSIFCLAV